MENNLPLHRRFRPTDFDTIFGNQDVVESLKTLFTRDKPMPHTFLFCGPTGCGKTTLGRILADKIGCNLEFDFYEINAANDRGIATAREIIENVHHKAFSGGPKVILIDECHRITVDFANAMLKPLEDTPDHVYFILCTTDPGNLLKTIRNRCTTYQVHKLSDDDVYDLVDWVTDQLKVDRLPDNVIDELVDAADGCPRQALVILDQVIDIKDPKKQEECVCTFKETESKQAVELYNAIMNNKSWKVISGIIKKLQDDPEKIRRSILGLANYNLLNGDFDASFIIEEFKGNFYDSGPAGLTQAAYIASVSKKD